MYVHYAFESENSQDDWAVFFFLKKKDDDEDGVNMRRLVVPGAKKSRKAPVPPSGVTPASNQDPQVGFFCKTEGREQTEKEWMLMFCVLGGHFVPLGMQTAMRWFAKTTTMITTQTVWSKSLHETNYKYE